MGGSLGTDLRHVGRPGPARAATCASSATTTAGTAARRSPPGPYEIADLGADVLALLDHLGIERASYCGLSIGGMVGMWLGIHAPERIDRLVLICTSAHMPPASAWAERAAAVRVAGSPEVVADTVVGRWLTPGFAAAHPEVRERLRAMLCATDAEGYAACCGAIERMDLRPDLRAHHRADARDLRRAGRGDTARAPAADRRGHSRARDTRSSLPPPTWPPSSRRRPSTT